MTSRTLSTAGLALALLAGCREQHPASSSPDAAVARTAEAAAPTRPLYLGPPPPAQVKRVVTLAPSLTEIVIALGAADRLAGVSRFDELPQVAKLPRVGGFIDPSVEAVVGLAPDLVLVQPAPGNHAPVEKMAALGTPVLALPMHTVPEVLEALREAGRALGVPERGQALADGIEATRARIRARSATLSQPRVLLVYEFTPLVVAGPGSFADELLRDAGARNAAEGAATPYPVYSAESAVRARPDVVVDLAHLSHGREALEALEGLKQARWVKPATQDLMHPGPGLGHGLEQLFALVHGTAAPDGGP